MALSKVRSVDQRIRLGMRCPLSPTADVPSHTSGNYVPGSDMSADLGSCHNDERVTATELSDHNGLGHLSHSETAWQNSPGGLGVDR